MAKLCIGKIVKAQGIKGELKVYPETDLCFFENLSAVYLNNQEFKTQIKVNRITGGMVYISLSSVIDRNTAEKMVGTKLYLDREDFVLTDDEYLADDLIQSKVFLTNGENYGEITEVNNYGSSDILTILGKYGKFQVVLIENLINSFDKENKIIILNADKFNEVKV